MNYIKSHSPYQELGERITRLREDREPPLKLKELAETVGCSRFVLYRIERGKVRSELEIIYKISCVFGMSIDELLKPAKWQVVRKNRIERQKSAARAWFDAKRTRDRRRYGLQRY